MKTVELIQTSRPDMDTDTAVERLEEHLRKLRKTKLAAELVGDDEHSFGLGGDDVEALADELSAGIELTWSDRRRIKDRVQNLKECSQRVAGLSHLKEKELRQLKPLFAGVGLVEPETEHWVDEVISELHVEMPWMARATEEAWHALRRKARNGDAIQMPPVLLNGPPGIGKSVWARRLSELLRLPCCEIDAGGGGVGFTIAGTERGWSSAQPGRPLETIIQHGVGNPLIVVDEICKAQSATSEQGARLSFADAMLALLEPATSSNWECPYFRVKFNMSHISWVLTSNQLTKVPEPLLSRCIVIDLPNVSCSQLKEFSQRQAARLGLSSASADAIEAAIELTMQGNDPSLSLRDVVRMLRRAETLEGSPIRH